MITVRAPDGAPVGITANSFTSVSLEPPLILWCLDRASARWPAFEAAEAFAVHVLERDQQAVCDAFVRATEGFSRVPWVEGPGGVPLIDGCLARMVCAREAIMEGGDHAILLARVLSAERRAGEPLVFQGGRYGGFLAASEPHPSPNA